MSPPERTRDTAGQDAPKDEAEVVAAPVVVPGSVSLPVVPIEPAPELEPDEYDELDVGAVDTDENLALVEFIAGEPEPDEAPDETPVVAPELEPEPEPEADGGSLEAPELEHLRRLGRARANYQRRLDSTETELYAAIRVAFGAGVAKLTIAQEAGVSRQTVYNVLARREAG